MGFTEAPPGLYLGFNTHQSTSSSNSIQSVPLQLLDQKQEKIRVDDGDDEDEDEKFNLLGHSICLKRPRDGSGFTPNPSKCLAVESGGLEVRRAAVRSWGNQPLSVADPELHGIMEKERHRQFKGIELVASENFVCRAVMEARGSHLTNKYSEGKPGARYYTGNQHIDQIKLICYECALATFSLDSEKWCVNVHPYSCTSANFVVYTGLLLPNE